MVFFRSENQPNVCNADTSSSLGRLWPATFTRLHMGDLMRGENWERLEEQLGAPDDPAATARLQALVADGWEFLGVRFVQGLWVFRRPRLTVPESDAPEP